MNYEDLKNSNQKPSDFNLLIFSENSEDVLFELQFEIAKCENMENVNTFLNNVSHNRMFYFCKDTGVRQPIGILVGSYFSSFDKFINSEELQNILKHASMAGFKAHDAKNLYMTVSLKSNDITDTVKRKIDMFVNLHPTYFKKIARRTKVNKIHYDINKDYYEFGSIVNNSSPVSFNENIINFKMFRSTLNLNTILSTIELCKLIFEFCKDEIYVDDLLSSNSYIEDKFENYVRSKSIFLKQYEDTINIKMFKENNILNDGNLNNNLTNCSDINIDDQNENTLHNYSDNWDFGKKENSFEYLQTIAPLLRRKENKEIKMIPSIMDNLLTEYAYGETDGPTIINNLLTEYREVDCPF